MAFGDFHQRPLIQALGIEIIPALTASSVSPEPQAPEHIAQGRIGKNSGIRSHKPARGKSKQEMG
jgi:hypothetical protein